MTPPPQVSLRLVLLLLLLVEALATTARAHPFSQSTSVLLVSDREVRARLVLDLLDLHQLPDLDQNRDNRISYPELDAAIERIYTAVAEHYSVRSAEDPLDTRVERYQLVDETRVQLDLRYRFAADVQSVEVTSRLDLVTQPNHRHVMRLQIGPIAHEAVLEISRPTVTFTTGDSRSYLQTSGYFVRLGCERLFSRYDHLALLLGLVVATTSLRAIVRILIAFTMAYSLTLALATVGAVVPPPRLTESLTTLSIAYVAVENLVRQQLNERDRTAVLFGIIHGFALSSVPSEMQWPPLPALSLLSFNTGVALGDVACVAVLFPIMFYRTSSHWQTSLRSTVSLAAICLSLYWFAQRVF